MWDSWLQERSVLLDHGGGKNGYRYIRVATATVDHKMVAWTEGSGQLLQTELTGVHSRRDVKVSRVRE
jgi:hypothetical protein